jgi:hypothetical protein
MRKSNQHYDDIDSLHHMITIFGVMTKEQVMTYLNVTQEKAHQVMTVFRRLNRHRTEGLLRLFLPLGLRRYRRVEQSFRLWRKPRYRRFA